MEFLGSIALGFTIALFIIQIHSDKRMDELEHELYLLRVKLYKEENA